MIYFSDKSKLNYWDQQGERNRHAEPTDDDVRAIRASTESLAVLAERYKMEKGSIENIITRKRYRHVK